jgi:hypothetical protein
LRHEVEDDEAERNQSAETIGNSCGGSGGPMTAHEGNFEPSEP